jgi:hypothetical protein
MHRAVGSGHPCDWQTDASSQISQISQVSQVILRVSLSIHWGVTQIYDSKTLHNFVLNFTTAEIAIFPDREAACEFISGNVELVPPRETTR